MLMEYKTKVNDAKRNSVDKLKNEFSQYKGYIFTDYRGLTVEQITQLRHQLRPLDSAFKVVKNNYAKIAMRSLTDSLDGQFVGPTAIAYVKGDNGNEIAKVLFKTAKDTQKLVVKAGYLDNGLLDAQQLEELSKLPSKLELIASLMGTMKAPVQKLAATLKAYHDKLGGVSDGGANAAAAAEGAQEVAQA